MSAFVSVLGDAPGNPGSISSLFTCCSGENACRDKAIAIDASASGILAKLPHFEKDELEIECLSTKNNSKQHLLRSLKAREGVRHLLRLSLLSLSRSKKLGDFLLEEDDCDVSSTERMHGVIPEEDVVFDLSKLASKMCQARPTTKRARREAVVALVAPYISRAPRDSRTEDAGLLDTSCDADCIEADPGAEEIEEESQELQDLASSVAGHALNDVFIFSNSEDSSVCAPVQPTPNGSRLSEPSSLPADQTPLGVQNSSLPVAMQQLDAAAAEEGSLSRNVGHEDRDTAPAAIAEVDPESVNVASRRGSVHVSLFTAYVTLLIVFLSDPIQAVWGGCTVATETWIRELCAILLDLGTCDGLDQARALNISLCRVSRKGSGQCPSLLKCLKELSDTFADIFVRDDHLRAFESRDDNDSIQVGECHTHRHGVYC